MNTPAHAILNLALLGRRRSPLDFAAIAFGAVLPDLPMVWFYGVQKLVLAVPENVIWGQAYYQPGWQSFFDAFNSWPLIALVAAFAWGRKRWTLLLLLSSMALHALADLPLHHDDGHRHLYPLSDWRFASPVSYWDPAHYGRLFGAIEIAGLVAGSVWLWRRHRAPSSRAIVALAAGSQLALVGYALLFWI